MKLFKRLDNLFAAAAFAEEGEHDTARHIASEMEIQAKEKEQVGAENINIGLRPAKNGRAA